MQEFKTNSPQVKAAEIINKMVFHQFSTGKNGGQEATRRAVESGLVAVDLTLYALKVPPISNEGHKLYDSQIDYWQQVRVELLKYISMSELVELQLQMKNNDI